MINRAWSIIYRIMWFQTMHTFGNVPLVSYTCVVYCIYFWRWKRKLKWYSAADLHTFEDQFIYMLWRVCESVWLYDVAYIYFQLNVGTKATTPNGNAFIKWMGKRLSWKECQTPCWRWKIWLSWRNEWQSIISNQGVDNGWCLN